MSQKNALIPVLVGMVFLAGCTSPSQAEDPSLDDPEDEGSDNDPSLQPEPAVNETTRNGSQTTEIRLQENYTGFVPAAVPYPANAGCPDGPPETVGPSNVGGACIHVPDGVQLVTEGDNASNDSYPAPRLHIKIEDDGGYNVGAYIRFHGSDGGLVDANPICNEEWMDLPPATAWVAITISEPGSLWCLEELEPSSPTAGTITATFTLVTD